MSKLENYYDDRTSKQTDNGQEVVLCEDHKNELAFSCMSR
jgi:hypothetical protein